MDCKSRDKSNEPKSNSNRLAFFVWQIMEFANSQTNMPNVKQINLQPFCIIHLA